MMKRFCAIVTALFLTAITLVPLTVSAQYDFPSYDNYNYPLYLTDNQCEAIFDYVLQTGNVETSSDASNALTPNLLRYKGIEYNYLVCGYLEYSYKTSDKLTVYLIFTQDADIKPSLVHDGDGYKLTMPGSKQIFKLLCTYTISTNTCTSASGAAYDTFTLPGLNQTDFTKPICIASNQWEYETHYAWFNLPDFSECPELGFDDFGRSEISALVDPEPFIGMNIDYFNDTEGFFQVAVYNNSETYYQTAIEIVDSTGEVIWRDNAQEMHYADTAGDYTTATYAAIDRIVKLPDFADRLGAFSSNLPIYYRLHDVQQQFGYSWWHITKPSMPYMQMYQWDDINLYAEAVYTLNVYAIPSGTIATDFVSIPSNNWDFRYDFAGGTNVYYFDEYSNSCNAVCPNREVITLYSRQFSFNFGASPTYNPNNENVWNDGKDNGYSSNWTDKSYSVRVDPETGAYIPTGNTGVSYDYNTNLDDITISSMQDLFDSTGGFMAFIQSIFNSLPPFMWAMVGAGLSAIIVMRILGR